MATSAEQINDWAAFAAKYFRKDIEIFSEEKIDMTCRCTDIPDQPAAAAVRIIPAALFGSNDAAAAPEVSSKKE